MKRIIQHTLTVAADLETPVGIYLKVRDLYPQSALLESSDYHASQNAVSFIGVNPIGGFKVEDGVITLTYPCGETVRINTAEGADVVSELRDYIGSFEIDGDCSIANGLLGYTAYDAVRYFERVDVTKREERFKNIPDIHYLLYRFLIEVDHYRNEMTIVENCPEGEDSTMDELLAVLHNNNMAQYPFLAADNLE